MIVSFFWLPKFIRSWPFHSRVFRKCSRFLKGQDYKRGQEVLLTEKMDVRVFLSIFFPEGTSVEYVMQYDRRASRCTHTTYYSWPCVHSLLFATHLENARWSRWKFWFLSRSLFFSSIAALFPEIFFIFDRFRICNEYATAATVVIWHVQWSIFYIFTHFLPVASFLLFFIQSIYIYLYV